MSKADTAGEKYLEEFFTEKELLDLQRFKDVGIVLNDNVAKKDVLDQFFLNIDRIRSQKSWTRQEILEAVSLVLPDFKHAEKNLFLDQKM